MHLKAFAAITAAAAVIALPLTGANAEELKLRFGHVGEPGSLLEASANHFTACTNPKLKGKAEVEVYGSSQLGNDQELLQKLKLGQVTFALPSTVMSSVTPEFGVFEMPYIIQNRDHMRKVRDQVVMTTLQAAVKKKGYRIIGVWENGFRDITNNIRPINTPEDLKGIKLRTPKGEWRVKMFKLYGANPSPMAFSEVFTALKTGVMDGQENPLAQIYSAKFQEVQKYLSITGHVYTPAYVVVSDVQFAKLPEDVQKVLVSCAEENSEWVYQDAAKLDDELLGKIKASSIKINQADKQAFIAASKPIYDEFSKTVEGGADLIKAVQDLAPKS
ncbi:MAG: TRAP transporter substrate-binding protein [Rhodomicrobiaceae bacterium]